MDKLEEIRHKFDVMDNDDNDVRKKVDKLLLKMLLKTGEEEKKLDKAELIVLENKIEEVGYDWEKSKESFQKYKVEKEMIKNVNETNYMDRRSRSRDRYGQNDRGRSRSWNKFKDNRISPPPPN